MAAYTIEDPRPGERCGMHGDIEALDLCCPCSRGVEYPLCDDPHCDARKHAPEHTHPLMWCDGCDAPAVTVVVETRDGARYAYCAGHRDDKSTNDPTVTLLEDMINLIVTVRP
jgi:hypothetical protein